MKGTVQYHNPEGLIMNPAFSRVVVVTGDVKTVFVGGQKAVDVSGNISGKSDSKLATL